MTATVHDDSARAGRRFPVAEVMSRKLLLLRARMRVEPAVALLVDHGFSGAPVIDERGRLRGMLHALDVAVMHLLPAEPDAVTDTPSRHLLVGAVCRAAVTIAPDSTMRTAADMMRDHSTDRLVVVEASDHVIGVVTGHDRLRTITRRGDLLREIVDARIAALAAPDVRADVDFSGVVLLTGTVDSAATRDRLLRVIGALDGVTEVDQLLTVTPDTRTTTHAGLSPD